MNTSAVRLHGLASRRGFDIIQFNEREAARFGRRFVAGDYVLTEQAGISYELVSRTDEANDALTSILNARTDHQLGAITSSFGSLGFPVRYNAGEYSSLADMREAVGQLRRLGEMLKAGDFSEANPLPNGLVMSPFAVAFNLWLVPAESVHGFTPALVTTSLYAFLAHEVITRAIGGRPMFTCSVCGDFSRSSRRDSRFCSGRCRTAHFRGVAGKNGSEPFAPGSP